MLCRLPSIHVMTTFFSEKERYLMSFNGSNELDIKMRPASKPRHSESDTDSEPESPM